MGLVIGRIRPANHGRKVASSQSCGWVRFLLSGSFAQETVHQLDRRERIRKALEFHRKALEWRFSE
jgi:hypothetical protein